MADDQQYKEHDHGILRVEEPPTLAVQVIAGDNKDRKYCHNSWYDAVTEHKLIIPVCHRHQKTSPHHEEQDHVLRAVDIEVVFGQELLLLRGPRP